MKKYKVALTIAGSDSSGGAGIQADLKTFSALGCYGASVITSLTAQNTQGVQKIFPVSPQFVQEQLKSIFSDLNVNAIKIGMLFSKNIIQTVAHVLSNKKIPLVIDPVMLAKNGDALLKASAIRFFNEALLPMATLLTPNLDEAEYLLKRSIKNQQSMQQAAQDLCNKGPKAVLLKGGHLLSGESNDCLYIKKDKKFYWFKTRRINTNNTHGTGCTLSSAITAYLARGENMVGAVTQAKKYVTKAIESGSNYTLGCGHGPVHHFHAIW